MIIEFKVGDRLQLVKDCYNHGKQGDIYVVKEKPDVETAIFTYCYCGEKDHGNRPIFGVSHDFFRNLGPEITPAEIKLAKPLPSIEDAASFFGVKT
jgi:hypothetical protein